MHSSEPIRTRCECKYAAPDCDTSDSDHLLKKTQNFDFRSHNCPTSHYYNNYNNDNNNNDDDDSSTDDDSSV